MNEVGPYTLSTYFLWRRAFLPPSLGATTPAPMKESSSEPPLGWNFPRKHSFHIKSDSSINSAISSLEISFSADPFSFLVDNYERKDFFPIARFRPLRSVPLARYLLIKPTWQLQMRRVNAHYNDNRGSHQQTVPFPLASCLLFSRKRKILVTQQEVWIRLKKK